MNFKPMLAAKAPDNLEDITFPVMVSPKLDGIRCLIVNGEAVSRNLKPIPNEFVRDSLCGLPEGLDGELMIRKGAFNDVQSGIMRKTGKPDFIYHVFDRCNPDCDWTLNNVMPFKERFAFLRKISFERENNCLKLVPHATARDVGDLKRLERTYLAAGYEGAMIRAIDGPYKMGRATTKQGWLMKLKRFHDAEATIVDVREHMHNSNEATKDNLGHTVRSSEKAGMVPTGKLGCLVCHTDKGVEFSIGTGFTDAHRKDLWKKRVSLLGLTVTYKYQPDGKNAPRFPVFLRFRIEE